jgi:ABC-type transport system substrate-binding protein
MHPFGMKRRRWLRLVAGTAAGLVLSRLADRDGPVAEAAAPASRSQAGSTITARTHAPLAQSVAQSGGVLRSADPFGAPSLDPINAVTTYIIQYGLGEALVRITRQGTVEPWLAESVTPIDPLRWRVKRPTDGRRGRPIRHAARDREAKGDRQPARSRQH